METPIESIAVVSVGFTDAGVDSHCDSPSQNHRPIVLEANAKPRMNAGQKYVVIAI
jgi:hypothetical protein